MKRSPPRALRAFVASSFLSSRCRCIAAAPARRPFPRRPGQGGHRQRLSTGERGRQGDPREGRQCVRRGGGRGRRAGRGRAIELGPRRRRLLPGSPRERRPRDHDRPARDGARRRVARHVSRQGRQRRSPACRAIPRWPREFPASRPASRISRRSTASCRSRPACSRRSSWRAKGFRCTSACAAA